MSRREKREARKQQRMIEQQDRLRVQRRKKLTKSAVTWLIVIAAIGAIGWWIFSQASVDRGTRFPFGQVHWHAQLDISVCGEERGLGGLGSSSHHAGLPLLHTHGDNLIHVEGAPRYYSDITLGRFFNGLGIEFSDTGIYEYENGDLCPDGSPGALQVRVNGELIQNATGYSVEDNDEIQIGFG